MVTERFRKAEQATTTSIIVCPTPVGGHIEHACDLAIATLRATGRKAIVLTRPGARDYLPEAVLESVKVFEIIPPLVARTHDIRRFLRPILLCRNLFIEHIRIMTTLTSVKGRIVLVLEEPRYPFAKILTVAKRESSICLIVHNAVEHSQANTSFVSKLRSLIARISRNQVSFIAVHGKRQMRLVRLSTSVPVKAFPLPGRSYVNSMTKPDLQYLASRFPLISETFVCLGELRANKGIEVAIEASRLGGMPLVVLGKKVDAEYYEAIAAQAQSVESVRLVPEFISPETFDYVLDNCRAVLLPYSQFDAQSGVLARAIDRGTNVVAADLPSLREQAGNSEHVSFFGPGSAEALARALDVIPDRHPIRKASEARRENEWSSISEWDSFADAVQSGWK